MKEYFFKLVCVNEQNPFEYTVLEDKNMDTLDKVHNYVQEHISNYTPETVKWMLIPMRKDSIKID